MKHYNLDIVIVCLGLPISGTSLKEASIGGSETAACQAAFSFAEQGHRVTLFCNTEHRHEAQGVTFMPMGWVNGIAPPGQQAPQFPKGFFDYARFTPVDVLLIQRQPVLFQFEYASKCNVLWQHDLATKTGPSQFGGVLWNIDKILMLSDFMKRQYQQVHGGPDELYHVTRNGIDLKHIDSVPQQPRDRFKLVYTARPERGLDILLAQVWPEVIKREPRARLYISRYADAATLPLYQELAQLAQRYGNTVIDLGNLTKDKLYELYKQARLFLYPSCFEEVSCCVGDTLIDLPRDYRKYPDGIPIRNLVGKSDFPVYAYDEKLGRITLGTVKWVAKTREHAPIYKLTLDDGSCLRATPDHKIMMRDGTYKELRELKQDDSLMPLYKHIHISVSLNNGCWEDEHRLVGEWKAGRKLDGHNEHVHHQCGYWSTEPDNLEVLTRSEHFSRTHKGKKRGRLERHKQRLSMLKTMEAMTPEQKDAYFSSRPKAARKWWAEFKTLSKEEQQAFYDARVKARREKFNGAYLTKKFWDEFRSWPEDRRNAWLKKRSAKVSASVRRPEVQAKIRAGIKSFWEAKNKLSPEELAAYKMWWGGRIADGRKRSLQNNNGEYPYNHRVVSIEPDGYEDVYDMEVDTFHNFVANGIVIHNCITSQEVGSAGAVMVGPWKAALPETCGGAHVLVREDGSLGREGDPLDPGFKAPSPAFIKTVVDQTVSLIHDDRRWEQLSAAARRRAEQWQWGPVTEAWSRLFHEVIGRKTADPKRVVRHFIFNSDVMAAQEFLRQRPDATIQKAVDRYVDKFVPFVRLGGEERRAALAAFYEARSGGAGADYRTAFWADTEPRLRAAVEFLQQHSGEVKTLLDFGCAHGGYVRALTNALPALSVLGVDVSPSLIRCAQELKAATLPDGRPAFEHPDNARFAVGDEDGWGLEDVKHFEVPGDSWSEGSMRLGEQFDAVLCMDTLEHLPHAEEVVAKLERRCKPNGWMIFTVPIGHHERSEFVVKGIAPTHVRMFDNHDVIELFGHRKDFHLGAFSTLEELPLDRSFYGWFLVAYRRDDKTLGQIDYERKFFLQGPRETLAACLITHNSEAELHRTLRSVQRIADEIVVVDNGPSSDRTVELAQEYTTDVRAGTSPFFCYTHLLIHQPTEIQPGTCSMAGFETPRNESVADTWADWILWIDSDEQLLEWRNLWKYLRGNSLLGYAMKQHHIAVDPPGILKQDIPVRLFRNHSGIKCIGQVHEHFELGINKGVGPGCMLLPDVHIHHDGYLTEPIRRQRFWRNFKLLECDRLKYPERVLGIFLMDIRDNMHLSKYALETNGQQVTPEVRQRLEQVVKTFKQHFLSDEYPFLTDDALNYYSEALAYLGQGMEVAVSLDVKPVNAMTNGATRFRAADQVEAGKIIEKLLRAKFQPFEGPYVA